MMESGQLAMHGEGTPLPLGDAAREMELRMLEMTRELEIKDRLLTGNILQMERLAGKLRSTDANAEAETVAAVLQMLRARPPFYSCALDDILVAARGQSAGLDRTELCCALRRRAETFVCDGRTVALREFPASDGGLVPQTDDFGGASSDHLVVQIEELLSFDDCCTSNACS